MNAFDYVAYDEKARAEQAEAKEIMLKLEDFLLRLGAKRVIYTVDMGRPAAAAAYEAAQVTYMWIGKQIRDNQIVRNDGKVPLEEGRSDS